MPVLTTVPLLDVTAGGGKTGLLGGKSWQTTGAS
jgi:hypothetical protein